MDTEELLKRQFDLEEQRNEINAELRQIKKALKKKVNKNI